MGSAACFSITSLWQDCLARPQYKRMHSVLVHLDVLGWIGGSSFLRRRGGRIGEKMEGRWNQEERIEGAMIWI